VSASGLHFKQIATGLTHTCAIRTDDQLWCWGTWGSSSGPPSVVSGPGVPTSWSQVDAGSGYTCAIDSNHKLWCWGADFRGWLGVGDTAGRSAPTRVNIGANDTDWKQVTTGQGHTCAIAFADNKLYCWGKNSHGNLGEGTTTDRTSPQAVATTGLIPDAWDSVSAGGLGNDDHTCAVGDNGTLWCWGTNLNGELGNGLVDSTFPVDPNQEHNIPAKVGLETTWESVAVGGAQVCGVQTDATTWCWGSNASGQIGQNSFIANYPAPTQVN